MPRLILLADIHANLSALEAVLADSLSRYGPHTPICQLGDVVDYGPRPNEVVERLAALGSQFLVNLAGNHEDILLGRGLERLSSDRGRGASDWTSRKLRREGRDYLRNLAPGFQELTLGPARLLFVHGDLGDPYWGRMGTEERGSLSYKNYDFVISGHSHIPHLDIVPISSEGRQSNLKLKPAFMQDRPYPEANEFHRCVFINPGSVGQPRDLDPRAHYAVLDLESGRISFEVVPYDIYAEADFFDSAVDPYYRRRLFIGI